MCGRFAITASVEEIGETFDLKSGLNLPARFNVAPTQPVAVVRHPEEAPVYKDKSTRELVFMQWGLVPHWSKELPDGKPLINARSETIYQKPSFRGPIRHKRCLVPTNGYYEWKTISGQKIPHFISLKSGDLFAFAGIWDVWTGKGGEDWLETLALITKVASPNLQKVHHRMPIMLKQSDHAKWLGEGKENIKDIISCLTPIPEEEFEINVVSKAVNNVRNEGENLIKPLQSKEPPRQGQLF